MTVLPIDPPAIFSNIVTVTRMMLVTHLSFGHKADDEIRYRVAVMMADGDAMALRDLLNKLFPPAEAQN